MWKMKTPRHAGSKAPCYAGQDKALDSVYDQICVPGMAGMVHHLTTSLWRKSSKKMARKMHKKSSSSCKARSWHRRLSSLSHVRLLSAIDYICSVIYGTCHHSRCICVSNE
ncbi:hypothetical protein M378DRAFT_1011972 [Amanita muscaria Koide BX008]|uniref:Uncharacterized protein n=1 Tax=Amanita muscaria (strain Koide BX008) TaxID=946122 RepID=A0A0C2WRJ1_AMAMK|nr:hypothetical protein M378DRAFT_1011972 [Amanita muscaria Koide BX008]